MEKRPSVTLIFLSMANFSVLSSRLLFFAVAVRVENTHSIGIASKSDPLEISSIAVIPIIWLPVSSLNSFGCIRSGAKPRFERFCMFQDQLQSIRYPSSFPEVKLLLLRGEAAAVLLLHEKRKSQIKHNIIHLSQHVAVWREPDSNA
jgi:hypothetical protein